MLEHRSSRTVRLDVRLTPDEKAEVVALSVAAGTTLADFVRGRLLKRRAVADELAKARAALAAEREARKAADRRAMRVLSLEVEVERLRKRLGKVE